MSLVRRFATVLFALAALAACTTGPKVPPSVALIQDAQTALQRIKAAPDSSIKAARRKSVISGMVRKSAIKSTPRTAPR